MIISTRQIIHLTLTMRYNDIDEKDFISELNKKHFLKIIDFILTLRWIHKMIKFNNIFLKSLNDKTHDFQAINLKTIQINIIL